MLRRHHLGGIAALSAAAAWAAACGSSSDATFASGGTEGAGGAASGTTGGTGGGFVTGCTPACSAAQTCSVTGKCIDKGTCLDKDDCAAGLTCDANHKCVPGGGCGSQAIPVAPVAPNLLIALDRSCSMTEVVAGKSKWASAVGAIDNLTSKFAGQIYFGLTMFPDTVAPNCDQDKIPIPPAKGNELAIQMLMTAALQAKDPNFPKGPCVTPIDAGLHQASLEPALKDPARSSYVLLITDGQQAGCNVYGGNAGSEKIVGDLFKNQKVATFVVGFGGAVDATEMNKLADLGGVPTGDPKTHFYNAADAVSLETALETIAKLTKSCTYALQKKVDDPSLLYVFYDKKPTAIAQDKSHKSGWDYDAASNSITFYGQDCTDLKNGTIKVLDIVYGCNVPPPG